jgi:hypothetical protein
LCLKSYDSNVCSDIVQKAQQAALTSTANSYSLLSSITDSVVASLQPGSTNACSSCYPGCLPTLSLGLDPVQLTPVYAADVAAMYQVANQVASVVESTLALRSDPLLPMQCSTYLGAPSASLELNLTTTVSDCSFSYQSTAVQGPTQQTGPMVVGANASVAFTIQSVFAMTGTYSVTQTSMSM